ncbi:hypothetical protein TNCV_787561 [Trichonephila clavipes]|nr:hypothetical protein TNCV_787561 [Trichonephila clavipes]
MAPVSTPEVSSVRKDSSPYPHLCRGKNSISLEKEEPVNQRRYLRRLMNSRPRCNLRQEPLQAMQDYYARICRESMGPTSCIPSSSRTNHEVNGRAKGIHENFAEAVAGSTCYMDTSTGTNLERNGEDSIPKEARHEFSLTHFWCFECRQSKPRYKGAMCLGFFGNFCCRECNENPAPPKFDREWLHEGFCGDGLCNFEPWSSDDDVI